MSENEPAVFKKELTRRDFMTGIGGLGIGAVIGGILGQAILLPDEVIAYPASKGYLLVDTKKCAGCSTCMLACSLVHTGKSSLSNSRIQVLNDVFTPFPHGVTQEQCRQCPYPACVAACPTKANHVDTAHGNVRTIDAEKCIGCERCIAACPFTPARAQWNSEERHSQKCDLCTDAPYWSEKGGIGGKQACIASCPVHAITFTDVIPVQSGDAGYQVNLRRGDLVWKTVSLPDGDDGEYTVLPGASGVVGG